MGCVACQKVPVTATDPVIVVDARETATVPEMDTGCVACQNVPETGWVACQNAPETGCVACQKVPVTAMLPGKVTSTFRLPELSTERACSRPSAPVPPTRIGLMPEVAVPAGNNPCTRGSPGTYALRTES